MDTLPLQLPAPALGMLAALAVGLVIGLERGWRERDVAEGGRVAGLRSFALVGLAGGVFVLGGTWLLAAGAAGVALLASVSYREQVRAHGSLSATSAITMMLTFGLGALAASGQAVLALGAAVVVAVLLNLKPTLHRWLRLIEHREMSAALQMGVLSAVVLPLLPDTAFGPYGALNPYRLWWAVVLIAGLSLAGHITMRWGGAQRGLVWTGVLGGLASSTAATLALARRVRDQPALHEPALAGTLAACAVMFLRLVVIVLAMAPALAPQALPPMLAAAAVLAGGAWLAWRRRAAGAPADGADIKPFDLGTALGFGAFLGVMAVLSRAAHEWLGEPGVHALALLSGVADVDAITITVARMTGHGGLAGTVAALAIGLAVLSNMVAKAGLAWTSGGMRFGRGVVLNYALAMAAGAAVLLVVARPG